MHVVLGMPLLYSGSFEWATEEGAPQFAAVQAAQPCGSVLGRVAVLGAWAAIAS